jgi:hypothetical protein
MKRTLATALLLAAFVVQAAHAVPAHALAGLRAAACCARRCTHCRSLSDAKRCCGVQARDDVAIRPAVVKGVAPRLIAQVAADGSSVCDRPHAVVSIARPAPHHERAAPLFLLVRSLRL